MGHIVSSYPHILHFIIIGPLENCFVSSFHIIVPIVSLLHSIDISMIIKCGWIANPVHSISQAFFPTFQSFLVSAYHIQLCTHGFISSGSLSKRQDSNLLTATLCSAPTSWQQPTLVCSLSSIKCGASGGHSGH